MTPVVDLPLCSIWARNEWLGKRTRRKDEKQYSWAGANLDQKNSDDELFMCFVFDRAPGNSGGAYRRAFRNLANNRVATP